MRTVTSDVLRGHAAVARLLLTLVLLLATGVARAQTPEAAAPPAAWTEVFEHWYVLELDGAAAGWMRETVSSDGARYRSESESMLAISRDRIEIEITMRNAFVETHDGRPIELHFVQRMARQAVETRWTFGPERVTSVSKQGDRVVEQEHPLPEEEWLTPMAAQRYFDERREAGADSITYLVVDGQNGLTPTVLRHERLGEGTLEFDGRTLPVTTWTTTSSVLPGASSTLTVSSDGHLLRDEVALPLGRLVTRVASKADALAAGAGPAPELLVQSFVPVDPPIERPRRTVTATLRLRATEGRLPDLPSAGAQRVEPDPDGRSAVLRIDIEDNVPAVVSAAERDDYLAASSMVDAGDTMIRKLAARACRDAGEDPMERAEAMRRAVHRHISVKSLDTAFATASETARLRSGDCSEHGVLLCAMLRTDGIPARVATGLVYADQFAGASDIFGWHMWTQALIDGHWVDFDATLPRRFDAAHVLTGTSSLSERVGSADLSSVVMLIGNLEIEVVDVTHE